MASNSMVLPLQQVEEIRKVWNIFDQNGDGRIERKELAAVLKQLSGGKTFEQHEIQELWNTMDSNKDGSIEWNEFLSVLSRWLLADDSMPLSSSSSSSSSSSGSVLGKRKESSESLELQELQFRIHKRITKFFLKFSKAVNFQELRDTFSSSRAWDNEFADAVPADEATKKAKLEACQRAFLEQAPQIAQSIHGQDLEAAKLATRSLRDIVSVLAVYRTPEERLEISEFVIRLFQFVVDAGLVARLIDFMGCDADWQLRYLATSVVGYVAPGPRIAATPRDSPLHPSEMFHKKLVMAYGPGNFGIRLQALFDQRLDSPEAPDLVRKAADALSRFAAHDEEVRDFLLLRFDFMRSLVNLFTVPGFRDQTRTVSKVVWAMAILSGHSQPRDKLPPYEKVVCALAPLADLIISSGDEEVVYGAATALLYLLPGQTLNSESMRHFLKFFVCLLWPSKFPIDVRLGEESTRVQRVVLETLLQLSSLESTVLQYLMHNNVLALLTPLLNSEDVAIRVAIVEFLTLAINNGFLQSVIDANLLPNLIQLLSVDDQVRWLVARFLRAATRLASRDQCKVWVVDQGLVKSLASALQHFKGYDPNLRRVYQYFGPSYNFEFVVDITMTLEHFLDASDQTFVAKFDEEVLDKIQSLLTAIVEALRGNHINSVTKSSEDIDERVKQLLNKIKHCYDRNPGALADHIGQRIKKMISEFDAQKVQAKAAQAQKQKAAAAAVRSPAFRALPMPSSSASSLFSLEPSVFSSSASSSSMSDDGSAADEPIQVKTYFSGDNRALSNVSRRVTLSELTSAISLKYGRAVILQVQDEEGDLITVDSPELLALAISRIDPTNYTLKLQCIAPASVSLPANFANSHEKIELYSPIMQQLHISAKELDAMYSTFRKLAKNERVDKAQFDSVMKQFKITNPVQLDQYFKAFDKSKDGFLDIREFMAGMATVKAGDLNARLELAFHAYDSNGDHVISRGEFAAIVEAALRTSQLTVNRVMIESIVESTFASADLDKNGFLDIDEFKKACLSDQLMLQQFWMHSTNSQSTASSSTSGAFYDDDMKSFDSDRELTCRDCKKIFIFDVSAQQSFAQKGFADPVRCKECADLKKKKGPATASAAGGSWGSGGHGAHGQQKGGQRQGGHHGGGDSKPSISNCAQCNRPLPKAAIQKRHSYCSDCFGKKPAGLH